MQVGKTQPGFWAAGRGRKHGTAAYRLHAGMEKGAMNENCYDVAHLGHVELLTDKFDESLDFFTRVFGLTDSGREDGSVYLRAFDDYEFHTLKLTAIDTTGVGHVGYRAASPQALERRVTVIEEMGCGIGWVEGDPATAVPIASPIRTATSSSSITTPGSMWRRRPSGRRSRTSPSAITAVVRAHAGSTI